MLKIDNHRPSNAELCGRLQDPLSTDTIKTFFSTSSINVQGGKHCCIWGNRGDAKKESDNSSLKQTRAIYKSNFYSPEEIFRISTSNKFKET